MLIALGLLLLTPSITQQDPAEPPIKMLSTGGCIIDPRPRPTSPSGGGLVASKDPIDDSEILVTYYQSPTSEDNPVDWKLYFKRGDIHRLYPMPGKNASGSYIELSGCADEKVRMFHEKTRFKLQRFLGDAPQTGTHDTIYSDFRKSTLGNGLAKKSGEAMPITSGAAGAQIELRMHGRTTGFLIRGNNIHTIPHWLNPGASPIDYRMVTLRPSVSGYAVRPGIQWTQGQPVTEDMSEKYNTIRYHWFDAGNIKTVSYELFVMKGDRYLLGLPRRRSALEVGGSPATLNDDAINSITISINMAKRTWSIALNGNVLREGLSTERWEVDRISALRVGKSSADENSTSISVDFPILPLGKNVGFTLHAKTISLWPDWVEPY